MDSKKLSRKPKHERRDALKFFNYDTQSSFSSFNSSSSVHTCSTDLYDRTSFRIDGIEGEFDPSLKIEEIDPQQQKEEDELSEKCEDRDRVTYEVAETVVGSDGGGCDINGIRPPMIKRQPGMRVRVVDNTYSNWVVDNSSTKQLPRKPKHERRDALKLFNYEAQSSFSSFDSSISLYTCSSDLYDCTSFRIEGIEGDFDRICRSLGLSGHEDFAIPAAAWEAMKFRSSSNILPSLKIEDIDFQQQKEEDELSEKCEDRDRVTDEVAETVVVGSGGGGCGINGICPPMIKAPPGTRVWPVDNTCSPWDLLKKLGPVVEGEEGLFNREMAEKESEKVDRVSPKKVEEDVVVENVAMVAEIVDSLLDFSTSNENNSSRLATEPRSNSVSPNGRIKLIITPGCWQKGDLLGRGSFGSVYEGISEDGFFFAVKEVSLLHQADQKKQSLYQLAQEIALLSRFEHDNIVQYYGTEMDESKLYIFIEFVTKGSLRNLYRKYTLRDSQVSAYTRQILHGLKYLHDQNVVHRNIKCANILVDANGSVKLADFGLAKLTKLNDSCEGTEFWMAPEVVKGKNKGYGLPADVWSLGCTVLEMLTGEIPYSNLQCISALYRIVKGQLPLIPDTLSRDAKDFILQCLQVNPGDRPTASQLLNHPFLQPKATIPILTSLLSWQKRLNFVIFNKKHNEGEYCLMASHFDTLFPSLFYDDTAII